MSHSAALVIAGLFGAIVGSFLNVCIYRLPRGESIVWPASACPHCKRQLPWYENVPILSFIALGARCRECRAPIAFQYPLVEALTSALFVLSLWLFGPGWLLVSRTLFGCALIVLFFVDLEHHLLPNLVTLPGIVIGFAFSLVGDPGWQSSLIGIVVGGGILFAIKEGWYWLRREEGLGMGDVKMLAMIGAFLGWQLTVMTLMMASVGGSLVGMLLIATRRGTLKYALPFGTFLATGAILAVLVGPGLLHWYLGLF